MNVYVITNLVNEKRYVGKANDPPKRWRVHVRLAQNEANDTPLYRAIRKYGAEAFAFETVERCQSEAESFDAEKRWIAKLNSTVEGGRGYNQTPGGEGLSGGASAATRARMSAAKRGRRQDPEAVRRRAESCKGNGKKAELMARIRECYALGWSNTEIAKSVGRTNSRVSELLKEMGLPSVIAKAQPLAPGEYEAIQQACQIESQSAVAKRFKRSNSLVSLIARGVYPNPYAPTST